MAHNIYLVEVQKVGSKNFFSMVSLQRKLSNEKEKESIIERFQKNMVSFEEGTEPDGFIRKIVHWRNFEQIKIFFENHIIRNQIENIFQLTPENLESLLVYCEKILETLRKEKNDEGKTISYVTEKSIVFAKTILPLSNKPHPDTDYNLEYFQALYTVKKDIKKILQTFDFTEKYLALNIRS